METVTDFILGGSKITADGDCRHKIKRHLLLGRKVMTNLSSVQSLSHVQLFATSWTTARQASLSTTNSRRPPKPISIESVMPSNHLILCCLLLLLPSIFPSIRVFSNESALHMRWPKDWSFSFNIKSYQWTPRIDLLWDGLAGSPCSPRDSQESSPTPQFKSFNSLALSLLYGPSLTSIHDYWKDHSFDYPRAEVLLFLYAYSRPSPRLLQKRFSRVFPNNTVQ